MLVATRDPPHHSGAHDDALPRHETGHAAPHPMRASRGARFITVLQIMGSLLGIPVGLASGYSIYRANFSVETTCQSLRTNIMSVIDKKVDAATRRMLVRHDVEAFEKSCGDVDPDAKAAFRALLTSDTKGIPAKVAVEAPRRVDTASREAARKPEPQAASATLATAAPAPAASDTDVAPRSGAGSDGKWLAEVRRALLAHADEQPQAARAVQPAATAAPQPAMPEARPLSSSEIPPTTAGAPMATQAPATVVAPARASDADHPVPPAPIPGAASDVTGTVTAPPVESRIGSFVAEIPLVGRAFGRTD